VKVAKKKANKDVSADYQEEPVQKANIPLNIQRELEEIGKSLGFTADEKITELEGDIPELIKFCNAYNYPPDSWRGRWEK
jgi:hypothetical protein